MRTISKLALVLLLVVFTNSTFAQNKEKFGHIDSGALMMAMPEKAEADKAIANHMKQLEDILSEMMMEYQELESKIRAQQDTLDEFILKTKIEKLQDMATKIEEFRMNAQQQSQKKQEEVYAPIIEKARKAIEDIAAENEYTYIFDTSVGVLLYWPKESNDVLPLVKKKLGIE